MQGPAAAPGSPSSGCKPSLSSVPECCPAGCGEKAAKHLEKLDGWRGSDEDDGDLGGSSLSRG